MSIHIIIDGYNLIRQSNTFYEFDHQDIQLGRDVLLDMLAEYKNIKHHRITVVFDGTYAQSFMNRKNKTKGINVLFSRRGETADTVIKRMALQEKEKALVVSSDREIADFASLQGSATVSSHEFEKKMENAVYIDIKGVDPEDEEETGWIPTTHKKGPKRKLSKKLRQNMVKIRKL